VQRCALGLIGWGTVGGGVLDLLARDGAVIRQRCGLDLAVTRIVTRDPGRARTQSAAGATVGTDLRLILDDPAIGTVIHLVGGTDVARDICLACIAAGKHVVTANKAMLAVHGDAIFAAAAAKGVGIAFEAAVAGAIPVIAAVRDGLVASRITGISAILNGTCNYILTRMEVDELSYTDALAEAQRLGYAEADPTIDVDGTDTAHKLALLARIAFTARITMADIRIEGIQNISFQDIESARTMGARIKLIAAARQRPEGLELRVAPTLVPYEHPLADVSRNFNGIHIDSVAAGATLLVGQGAGALPTASAVLADVVDVVTGRYQLTSSRFNFFTTTAPLRLLPETEEVTSSYARFQVPDKPGILAGITNLLSQHGVSVQSIHQGQPDDRQCATIEVVTHPLPGGSFLTAIEAIDRQGLTIKPTVTLRRL